jgi:putative salt-induced outer membrane protein YdiY
VLGKVVLSNNIVMILGPQAVSQPLELLTGITPHGGKTGIRNWSGKLTAGISLQSGNNKQETLTTTAELDRRTPNTTLLLNFLGNYSQANGVENVNNDRVNVSYDVRLNHNWFVRPVQLECYHDPLANIAYRLTGGVGAGYYIFDQNDLEWTVNVGPSFQYTRFDTVEPGEPDTASTPASVLESNFKYDLTSRLTFIQTLQSTLTRRDAGEYTHHAVTTLEFEIKRHLNLDVSFIWDFLQNPQPRSDGSIPQRSDYYLTVGFGVRF